MEYHALNNIDFSCSYCSIFKRAKLYCNVFGLLLLFFCSALKMNDFLPETTVLKQTDKQIVFNILPSRENLFSHFVKTEAVYLVDISCFRDIHKCKYFISWVLFVKRIWGIIMLRTYVQEPWSRRRGTIRFALQMDLKIPDPFPPLLVSLSKLRLRELWRRDFLRQERCKEESSLWSIQIGNSCLAWGQFRNTQALPAHRPALSPGTEHGEWRSWAWRVLTSNRSF